MAKRPAGVCAFLLSLVLLGSCTDDDASPPATEPAPTDSTRAPAVITRDDVQKLPTNQTNLPVLRTGLPRRAPAENAVLPPLLDNLPGTATMAYHPPENYQDLEGWVGEDVFFYGTDGTWRRLQLEDLGVPESAWPGPDTLGAGDLSPNGRWWAVESDAGVIVVSLATGNTRLIDLPGQYMNFASGFRTAARSSFWRNRPRDLGHSASK